MRCPGRTPVDLALARALLQDLEGVAIYAKGKLADMVRTSWVALALGKDPVKIG